MHFLKYLHCFNPNLSTIAQENLKSVSDEELLKNSCLLVYIYRKRVWTYVIIHNLLGGKLIDLNVWMKKMGFIIKSTITLRSWLSCHHKYLQVQS